MFSRTARRATSKVQTRTMLAAAVVGLGLMAQPITAATWGPTPTDANWSNATNWGGVGPVTGDTLTFSTSTITALNNDLAANFALAGIIFTPTSSSYVLSGNAINFGGTIVNQGTNSQLINLPMTLTGGTTVDPGSGASMTLAGVISGGSRLTETGSGMLTISGLNVATGGVTVASGKMLLTGRLQPTASVNVGNVGGGVGQLVVSGGALFCNLGGNGAASLNIGNAAGAVGDVRVNSGILTTGDNMWLGTGVGGFAAMTVNNGTVTVANAATGIGQPVLLMGGAGDNAILNLNGGLVNVLAERLDVAYGSGGVGVVNINSGVFSVTGAIFGDSVLVGENGTAIMTVGNGGTLGVLTGFSVANNAGATGVFNLLSGGTLLGPNIGNRPGGNSTFNFNGGLIKASGTVSGTWFRNMVNAFVYANGAFLDDSGQNTTVLESLQVPVGNGITGIAVTGGTGYIDTPVVTITGGGGFGATAVGNIGTDGSLLGITITNPGVNYTFDPTVTISGASVSGATVGTISQAPNVGGGGVTKIGGGTMNFTGTLNNYTGPTVAAGGITLTFSAAAANNEIGTNSLTFNGLALRLNGVAAAVNSQTFASSIFNPGPSTVTLAANGTANTISLSMGPLTRNPGSTVNFVLQPTAANPAGMVTTSTSNANFLGGQATILGGYATVAPNGLTVGNTWATVSGGNIAGLASYSATFAAGTDVDAPAGPSAPAAITINSLRFNNAGAATVDTTAGLAIATGGILETTAVGNSTVSFSNGTITSGNGQDLIVIQNNTAGALSIGSQIIGNIALTKSGTGSLVLTNVANSYTGKTFLNGGVTNIAAEGSLGAVPVSVVPDDVTINGATLQLGAALNLSANRGITLADRGGTIDTNSFSSTFAGVVGGPGGLTKVGAGSLTIAANAPYGGATSITGGMLALNGNETLNTGVSVSGGQLVLGGKVLLYSAPTTVTGGGSLLISGNVTGQSVASATTFNVGLGTLTVTGALTTDRTITIANTANVGVMNIAGVVSTTGYTTTSGSNVIVPQGSFLVGSVAGATGDVQMSGGTLTTTGRNPTLVLGGGVGAYAGLAQSGGAISTGSNFVVGANNDNAVFSMSGGSFTVQTGTFTIASGAAGSVGQGVATIGGSGNFVANAGVLVGERGIGVLSVTGNGALASGNVNLAPNSTDSGFVNLLGGTLTTNQVLQGGTGTNAVGILNFNGGTLKAGTASSSTFVTGLTSALVYANNAIFDDSGRAITVGQPLLTPGTTSGLTAIAVAGGTGYVDAPVVSITSGGGVGATAVANIGTDGSLLGITVTNPGTGYTAAPTVTLLGGGGTGAAIGSLTLATSNSGGLTKNGAGSLTLSSTANTYTGTTTVNNGVLRITGALLGMGPVQIGSGAALGGGAAPGSPAGSGIINGAVSVLGGGAINMQDNLAGSLTLNGGLVVGDATTPAVLQFDIGGTNGTNPKTSDLIVLGASPLTVNAGGAAVKVDSLGAAAPGDLYTVMTYGSKTGTGNVTLDAGSVHSGLNTNQLFVNPTNITLTVTGAPIPGTAYWTGELDSNWNATFFLTLLTGNSNFHTDATSGTNTNQFPGTTTDVNFATINNPGATNLATTLGQNFDIKSLRIRAGTGAVSISGASTGSANTLTLEGGGMMADLGSSGLTINAGVVLDLPQTWIDLGASVPTTINGVVSGTPALGLGGPGTIVLAGANTYSGGTTIGAASGTNQGSGGTVIVGNGSALGTGAVAFAPNSGATLRLNGTTLTVGALSGDSTSTIMDGHSANGATLIVNGPAGSNTTYGGALTDGGTGRLGVRLTGSNLTLTGPLSYTGSTDVRNGTLTLSNTSLVQAGGSIAGVGDIAGQSGVLILNNANFSSNSTGFPSMVIGASASGASGAVYVNGTGSALYTNSELWLASDASNGAAYGALIVNGGSVYAASYLAMARGSGPNAAGNAILDLNSGSIQVNGAVLTIGSYQGANPGVLHAVATVSGGTLTTASGVPIYVAEYLSANLNIMNAGQIVANGGVALGFQQNGETGILNLLGGTLTTTSITRGGGGTGGTGIFNFNGGTLAPLSVSTTFNMTGLTSAYVWPNGAIIDDLYGIIIAQPLLAPTGNGVVSIPVTTGGTGYIAEPMVTISGGGGTGATAIAVVDPTGKLTGITITNPGVGYTGTPTVTLSGGGGTSTLGAAVTGPNASGGLTKSGTAITTLSGNNTYTGATTIKGGGTLAVSSNTNLGAVATGAAINLDNGTLEATSSMALDNAGANPRPITISTNGGGLNADYGVILTVNGAISGNGALTINPAFGAGTVVLGGANTYTGPTTITMGKLNLTGALSGAGNVSVSSGATLGGNGTITGAVSLANGSTLSTIDGKLGTLTLGGGLTADTATVKFDVGGAVNNTDRIALGSSAFTVTPGGATIVLNNRGIAPATYTLMTYNDGAAPTGLTLDPASVHVGGSTFSLNATPTALQLVVTGAVVPTVAYWTNSQSDLNWSTATGASFNQTNWSSDSAGLSDTLQIPGAVTDVRFSANNGISSTSTSLGRDLTINSITVLSSETQTVYVSGSSNLLSLEAAGGIGITTQAGSGGLYLYSGVNISLDASQTWQNLGAETLTVSGVVSGNASLTLAGGPGTIALGGANLYTGNTIINSGTIQLGDNNALGAATNALTFAAASNARLQLQGNSLTVGGLNGDGTAAIDGSGGTLTLNSAASNVFAGSMQDSGGSLSLLLIGGGSLSLGGINTYTGSTTVRSGLLAVSGQITSGNTATITVGDTSGANAVLAVNGGTVLANNTGTSIQVGTVANSAGSVKITSGNVTTANTFRLGNATGGYSALSMSGGTLTIGPVAPLNVPIFIVGATGDRAVVNMSGGVINVPTERMTLGTGTTAGAGVGVVNLTGGTINVQGQNFGDSVLVGENTTGILTVSGTGLLTMSGALDVANNNTGGNAPLPSVGFVNLLTGGTIASPSVGARTGGNSTFSFNGGTLRAITSTTPLSNPWFRGMTNAFVFGNGAILDDGGLTVTVAQALLKPSGSGVASIPVTGGVGYIDTPVVTLTGGGGFGATAVANVDGNGNITGITVTNPGVNYTAAPTVTITGGGGTGAAAGVPTLATNISGGLTKQGGGTLILSAANTFSGNTSIAAGTLALTNTLALQNSTVLGVTVAGTALAFDSSVGTHAFTFGGLSGNGTVTLLDNATTPNAVTLSIGNNNSSTTFSGLLTGNGSLIKIGTGTTMLTGNNPYGGTTAINGGVLNIAANNNIGAAANGATLSFSGGTLQTSQTFALDNGGANSRNVTLTGSGMFNLNGANTLTVSGVVGGSGNLTLTGNGVLVLTGNNTNTGQTFVNGGTLSILANNGLGAPATGATLNLNGGTLQTANTFALDNAGANKRNVVLGASGGTFNMTSASTLTVSGTLSGNGPLNVNGSGTLKLTGNATYTGLSTVGTGATLEFANGGVNTVGQLTGNAGTFTVDAGTTLNSGLPTPTTVGTLNVNGVMNIAANASLTNRTGKIINLNIAPAGLLNVANNNLIVVNGSNVQSQIKQAANLGAWTGTAGITSSSARTAGTTSTATALAYATGAEYTAATGNTLFDSVAFNPTDTLVKYTLAGDANMDGSVTFADFLALQNDYNKAGDWSQGDWNYDGQVTFADFLILQNNYNKVLAVGNLAPSGGSAPAISTGAAPEPASLLVLALGGAALLTTRRRRRIA